MQADAKTTEAFLHILRTHQRLVQKICGIYASSREDREDLAGEIILQLWRAFPKYRRDAAETTWLYRVALNTAISQLRSAKRRPAINAGEEWLIHLPDTSAKDEAEAQQLQSTIMQLPELERALMLLFLEDRSHAEIAVIMGISVSNVGTRLGRIKDKLKKMMGAV